MCKLKKRTETYKNDNGWTITSHNWECIEENCTDPKNNLNVPEEKRKR